MLVDSCNKLGPSLEVDWRAFATVFYVWKLLKMQTSFECRYVPRCQIDLVDKLVKQERLNGWCYTGFTFLIFLFSRGLKSV